MLKKAFQILNLIVLMTALMPPDVVQAVPSFARQSGLSCFECHTIYPELTPFGRQFKLNGYVMSKSDKPYEFPPPLAGMVVASLSHTDVKLPSGYFNKEWSNRILSHGNDVLGVPEEANLYYAGRIYGHTGAFVQGTYEGDANSFHLDMTDIRFANSATLFGESLVYGISLNNSPTMQDLWNSTPTWGYPFERSEVAPAPAAAAIIDGTLDQQVGGIGIYCFWNQLLYAEFSAYRTTNKGIARPLGAGTKNEMVVDGFAPYWRAALQYQWGVHNLAVGTYGMMAKFFPDGRDYGLTDKFTDMAFDSQYQYLNGNHSLSLATTWIHEWQDRDASVALGEAKNLNSRLDTFRMNMNFYYKATFGRLGGSAAYFATTGSADNLLYAPTPVDGSGNGSPNSNGLILEAVYLPVDQLRLLLQYTIYNEFNGSHSNYDGSGRKASDNNTLYVAATMLF